MYIANKVDYCMYGFDYKKSTTLYSNYNLGLKTCNHTNGHKQKIGTIRKENQTTVGSYQQRAAVPPLLIKEVLKKFLKEYLE